MRRAGEPVEAPEPEIQAEAESVPEIARDDATEAELEDEVFSGSLAGVEADTDGKPAPDPGLAVIHVIDSVILP